MRTQWTTKRNRGAGSSCSCDRGLHRYLRNFGGGGVKPSKPPSVRHWLVGCPEASVRKCRYSPCNNPEERVSRFNDCVQHANFVVQGF